MVTIGRIVLYRLREQDAKAINRRRSAERGAHWPDGAQAHFGNPVQAGEVYPMVVCRVWPNEYGTQPGVNGQVILDGSDSLWVTSAKEGDLPGEWSWPVRSSGAPAQVAV